MFKKIYKNYFFRWIIIPTLIFLSSVSLLFINLVLLDFSPSIISYNHSTNSDVGTTFKEIKNGEELTGTFKAVENNLGIVSLYFKLDSPIKGKLRFELYDDQNQIIASNEYDSRELYYLSEYPFGFDLIPDSKDKKYNFHISFFAENGYIQEIVNIKQSDIVSKYKVNLRELISDKNKLFNFIIKKYEYSFFINHNYRYYLLYFSPLLLFLTLNFLYELNFTKTPFFKKISQLDQIKHLIQYFDERFFSTYKYLFLANLFYILFLPFKHFSLDLILILIWAVYIKRKNLTIKSTYLHACLISVFLPLILVLNLEEIIQKNISLVFFYILIALIQSTINLRKYENK